MSVQAAQRSNFDPICHIFFSPRELNMFTFGCHAVRPDYATRWSKSGSIETLQVAFCLLNSFCISLNLIAKADTTNQGLLAKFTGGDVIRKRQSKEKI